MGAAVAAVALLTAGGAIARTPEMQKRIKDSVSSRSRSDSEIDSEDES